jgi:hypothetical protein
MKALLTSSLLSLLTTTAYGATGWYCEGFCHSHAPTNSACRENIDPIASKGDDPVSAINSLRNLCFQKQNTTHCEAKGWWVNHVNAQYGDSGVTASIGSACRPF